MSEKELQARLQRQGAEIERLRERLARTKDEADVESELVEEYRAERDRLRLLAYQMQTTLEMLYNCGEHPDVKALDLALQMIEKAREALAQKKAGPGSDPSPML